MYTPDNMPVLYLFLLLGAAVSAVVYLRGYLHGAVSRGRSFWKTLPVALMAAAALVADGPLWLVLALVLSALGDFFLSRAANRFVPGLLAFLAAHLAYVVLFSGLAGGTPPLWALAAVGAYGAGFAVYLWPRTGAYRWPVMAYILVISTMALSALRLWSLDAWLPLGAFVFVLSDTLLALRMFVLAENTPLERRFGEAVWWSYIVAQLILLIVNVNSGYTVSVL